VSLAQPYPAKPVRVIVPAAAGSSIDLIARLVGPKLTEAWGQPVVVDNVVGAGGLTGSQQIANSPRDGHVLGIVASNLAVTPALFPGSFNVSSDFTAITMIAGAPLVLFVNPNVEARSIRELIASARAKPGSLNYASAGNGSASHLAGELFKSMAEIDLVHVPYKSLPQGIADAMGGPISMVFANGSLGMQHVKAGKLRALAVSGATRSPSTGDLPTLHESGLAGFDVTPWFGMVGPGSLAATLTTRIYAEVSRIVQTAEIRERFGAAGLDLINSSPAQFRSALDAEVLKWGRIVKASGAKID
jgi:tripartite-type tricarboxylate transporter receptor subunit TctC